MKRKSQRQWFRKLRKWFRWVNKYERAVQQFGPQLSRARVLSSSPYLAIMGFLQTDTERQDHDLTGVYGMVCKNGGPDYEVVIHRSGMPVFSETLRVPNATQALKALKADMVKVAMSVGQPGG